MFWVEKIVEICSLSTLGADKRIHHQKHCLMPPVDSKPENGSHKYTEPDCLVQLSGPTVITGVKIFMVVIDHL
jgi:hypothetical protein